MACPQNVRFAPETAIPGGLLWTHLKSDGEEAWFADMRSPTLLSCFRRTFASWIFTRGQR